MDTDIQFKIEDHNKKTYTKITCSTSNSACIDYNNEIYVWGSGKTGLGFESH